MRKRAMALRAFTFLLLALLLPGGCRKQEAAPAAATAPVAAAATSPKPEVSPVIPADVSELTEPLSTHDALPYFDDFSWREFIALTWPAKTGPIVIEPDPVKFVRGVPDTKAAYGVTSGPLVFLTWKNDYEIFLPNGAPPKRWNSFDGPSPCTNMTTLTSYQTVLASFSHFHGFNEAGMGSYEGPLIDQNQKYVRYQTAVNELEFNFITHPNDFVENGKPAYPGPLYLTKNLPGTGSDRELAFPTGSIEIKAAWRLMDGVDEAQRKRFYITEAQVLDPTDGKCTKKAVGLVGLHIINKTHRFPKWVWSTFEQVDNVPAGAPDAKERYSFNNGKLNEQKTSGPGGAVNSCNPPEANPVPTQVIRENPIAESTRQTNASYHALAGVKGTVWENYILTLTQWPISKNPPGMFPSTEDPKGPVNTANTTMETWHQARSGSCMACHQESLDDFVWFLPLGAYPQKPEECASVNAFLKARRTAQPANGVQVPNAQTKAVDALKKFFAEHPAGSK